MSPPEDTVTERSEAELATALRSGEREAVAVLFDRHAERIYHHCFRLTADRSDAEDATASTFLEVWRHHHRVHVHDGSALPWLYGVATNVCRNLTRSRRRHLRAVARIGEPVAEPDHADAAVDRLDSEHRMREVLAAVDRLPQRERDVVALVAWSGLTYEEAAAALDVPVGTVRSRLSRARQRLARSAATGPTDEGTTP
jgi:RNA polymerase sigma factor (sigma-70 family)